VHYWDVSHTEFQGIMNNAETQPGRFYGTIPPKQIAIIQSMPYLSPSELAKLRKENHASPTEKYGFEDPLSTVLFLHLQFDLLGKLKQVQKMKQPSSVSDLIPSNAVYRMIEILAQDAEEKMLTAAFIGSLTKFSQVKQVWQGIPRPFEGDQEKFAVETFDRFFAYGFKDSDAERERLSIAIGKDPVSAVKTSRRLMMAIAEKLEADFGDPTMKGKLTAAVREYQIGELKLSTLEERLADIRIRMLERNLPSLLCDLSEKPLPVHIVLPPSMKARGDKVFKDLRDAAGNRITIK